MAPRCLLFATLALPWFVHAAVVSSSTLGAHPLSGRLFASVILALGLLLAVACGWSSRGKQVERAAAPAASPLVPRTAALLRGVTGVGVAALVACSVLALLLPVVAYDALWYRLPALAQWLDRGRIYWVESDDPVRNGYPLGQEAVSAVVVAATGSFALTDFTSIVFVASGAVAICWLSEVCGVRPLVAQAAGALFVLVPMTLLNAGSGYSDAAFAGATISLFCLAARLPYTRGRDDGHAVALGMAAASVLALKGTGLGFVLVTGLVLVLSLRPAETRAARARSLLIATLVMLPGTYWAVRNVVHMGNPLWPVRLSVGGLELLPGLGSIEEILDVKNNTPHALATSSGVVRTLRTWLQLRGPAVTFDDRWAGLGWAWPLLALPALAACAWHALRRPSARALLAPWLVLALLTLVCLGLQPMRWWSRYTLWLWGAGAVAMACEAERLLARGRQRQVAWLSALVLLLTTSEATVALFHAHDAGLMLARWRRGQDIFAGPRSELSAAYWVPSDFWAHGLEQRSDLCRSAWKPGTDDAILDGVFAQLSPRPRMHVIADEDGDWGRALRAVHAAHCTDLLLLRGSPLLEHAARDQRVRVESVLAFDPLFLVRTAEAEP